MAARKKDPVIQIMEQQAKLKLVPIAMPCGLNDFFSDIVIHLGNVFRFMQRYAGQDQEIKKLLDVYESLPNILKRDPSRIDLDYLATKAGVEPIVVKERLILAYVRWGESKFKFQLTHYGPAIVEKTIAIALDDDHPDGQACRELILQYLGIKAMPKSQQININTQIGDTSINNNQLNIGELQPMHETLGSIEKAFKESAEKRLLEASKAENFIDLDELEKVDEKNIDLVAGEDYFEDSLEIEIGEEGE